MPSEVRYAIEFVPEKVAGGLFSAYSVLRQHDHKIKNLGELLALGPTQYATAALDKLSRISRTRDQICSPTGWNVDPLIKAAGQLTSRRRMPQQPERLVVSR